MNAQKTTAILTSLMLLAGCPGQPGPSGPAATDHHCPGTDPAVTITINYNGPNINVAPTNREVDEGGVLRFHIVGADGKWVSTSGKKSSGGWISGIGRREAGNPASENFYVCVPYGLFPPNTEPDVKKEFEYNVDVEDKDRLDPIVTVRKL